MTAIYFSQEATFGKYQSKVNSIETKNGGTKNITKLTYVPNYIISVGLPDTEQSEAFQEVALARLLDLQQQWIVEDETSNPHHLQLEFFTVYAYLLEYERALMNDMPLVPVVFYVMLVFTCAVFHLHGDTNIQNGPSRFTLGFLSTWTIGMSLASGYGLMFCWGIPFTNLSEMLPFIVLGVGLDDTFIITGAYFRQLAEDQTHHRAGNVDERNDEQRFVDRIETTMEEVGLSISLTTATTTFAFALGCISTIPGIRWLCMYASVTIIFVFLYQITYFVALLAVDELRVNKAKTRGKILATTDLYATWEKSRHSTSNHNDADDSLFTQRIMRWYGQQLLRPWIKKLVLGTFIGVFVICLWRTTMLTQEFVVTDYVPEDSFTGSFMSAHDRFSSLKVPMTVYFRDVNQSDPMMQQHMINYIDALSELPQIQQPPDFCWVRDLKNFMNGDFSDKMDEKEIEDAKSFVAAIQAGNKTFSEQIDIVLKVPTLRDVYGGDIIRDEHGEITASRCFLFVRHIDLHNIKEQIQLLIDQRTITQHFQPELMVGSSDWNSSTTENKHNDNDGGKDKKDTEWSFFTFDSLYYYWELYTVAVQELIMTTISGVLAVCGIGFLLVPHWTAVFFICPTIIMLYFDLLGKSPASFLVRVTYDLLFKSVYLLGLFSVFILLILLGTLQYCGVHINAVTYVLIVISIGLLVDFVMHILLRYYEAPGKTRKEKVLHTLETMGASMMLGGLTVSSKPINLLNALGRKLNVISPSFFSLLPTCRRFWEFCPLHLAEPKFSIQSLSLF